MVSLTEVVAKSEKIELSDKITLLVPTGRNQQAILECMLHFSQFSKSIRLLDRETILSKMVSMHDRIRTSALKVYIVAPGAWNDEREYAALACGGGMAIMASLASCGYDALDGKLMQWHNSNAFSEAF